MGTHFFISKNYRHPFTASSKAKIDVENILTSIGYRNVGLKQRQIAGAWGSVWTFLSNIKAFFGMPSNGVILLQCPQHFMGWKIKKARRKGNKIITVVHDLNSIRKGREREIGYLKSSDIIIVHTPSMRQWMIDNDIANAGNIRVLEVFDYLNDEPAVQSDRKGYPENGSIPSVAFAGNLGKSRFIGSCAFGDVRLKLFGKDPGNLTPNNGVEYVGCFPPEELQRHLDADFGLVWDGDSCETCSGALGEYLRLIAPHKLSMYLSAGLPVVVWKESAMAPFVEKNGVGVAVDSLEELDRVLVSEKVRNAYSEMKRNARLTGEKIRSGYFLSKALQNL